MRPEGRLELESLYFDYPEFASPADRAPLGMPAEVAIVGAGPVGMTAALTLARYGVRSVVLEQKRTFNDGSRAICIARQSMQIFETLNAVGPFLDKALPYVAGRTFYRGEQILRFEMADSPDEKFRPMYNLQQQYIEAYLYEAVEASPFIDVRWGSEVRNLTDIEDGIRLSIADDLGAYEMDASWVVAADGARSTVRRLRGLRLQGENYEGRYVIADIRMAFDHPTERIALFDPSCRRGGTVLVHRQPDSIWRVDYQLTETETEDEALREDTIRTSVASVLRDIGYSGEWELEWWSMYSANTLALEDYRDGRVFFAGDSAHIVPIFGVRGLNNGFADAQNLGWKLAWVLQDKADERLLESYTPERRGATMDVFANAAKATRFMTPPTRGWTVMRDAALLLALRHPFAGEFANPRNMVPYTYAEGSLTRPDRHGFTGGPIPGAVAPNVALEDGFLLDRFGAGFNVVVCGALEGEPYRPGPEEVSVVAIVPGSEAARVYDADEGAAYLFRPDFHLCARWRKATWGEIRRALEWLLEGGSG